MLGDVRSAVRLRAVQTLAARGPSAVPPLKWAFGNSQFVEARRNAVWVLCRLGGAEALPVLREALKDKDSTVRHAAIHSLAILRDKSAVPALLEIIAQSDAPLRRAAAEALGRIGDSSAVAALLKESSESKDPVFAHSALFAVIEIANPRLAVTMLQKQV